MSIRLILFFPLVSNYCQVMQLKRNEAVVFVIDDMITQEKIQKLLLFFVWGWGGGGKLPKFSNKLLTAEQSSGIHIGLRKVLQLWTIKNGNYYVKLA